MIMSFPVFPLQLLVTNIINKKLAFQGPKQAMVLVPKLISLSSVPGTYMLEILKVLFDFFFKNWRCNQTVSEVL